jgi:hypothetical protein
LKEEGHFQQFTKNMVINYHLFTVVGNDVLFEFTESALHAGKTLA